MSSRKLVIEVVVTAFVAVGLFGNLNVVVAVLRQKELRNKSGCLVFVLTLSHLVCLCSEILGLVLDLRFRPMSRRTCFELNAPYLFCILFQSALFLGCTIDMALSILAPIRHRLWETYKYVRIVCIVPMVYSMVCCVVSYAVINDEVVSACIPVTAPPPAVYMLLSAVTMMCNVSTVAIAAGVIYMAMHRERPRQDSRRSYASSGSREHENEEKSKIFRSTFYLMTIYIASWVVACFLFEFFTTYYDQDVAEREYLPYLILVAMPTYCQTYFVTFARSPRFRRAYKQQLRMLTCGLLCSKSGVESSDAAKSASI